MINNNNNFEQHKQTFPKAVQYADEILNGDYTLESLNGQIPNSWISAVKTELESRGYLVLSENGNKENIENNISPEKISTEIEQAKQEFINETDRAVEQVGNIGMTTNPKVIEQVKQETNFDQDISNLKNEAEKKLTNLEYIEHVNNQIKQGVIIKSRYNFYKTSGSRFTKE